MRSGETSSHMLDSPRRLAAILCADIAGYSRLMGADEERTHARIKRHRREIVEPTVAEHHGQIVKNTGDGFLAMFASPVEAVRCAIVIQQSMIGRNAALSKQQWVQYRIGINLGDVLVDPEDIYGDGVNIAARLERLAEPGSVYISGGVYEQIKNKLVCAYQSLGDEKLKNITDPVRVYRVLPDPDAFEQAKRSKHRSAGLAIAFLSTAVAAGLLAWQFLGSTHLGAVPVAELTSPAGPPASSSSPSASSAVESPGSNAVPVKPTAALEPDKPLEAMQPGSAQVSPVLPSRPPTGLPATPPIVREAPIPVPVPPPTPDAAPSIPPAQATEVAAVPKVVPERPAESAVLPPAPQQPNLPPPQSLVETSPGSAHPAARESPPSIALPPSGDTPPASPQTGQTRVAVLPVPRIPERPPATVPVFRDCPNCPEMINIPGGTFVMGSAEDPSEKPAHQVTVPPFAMGRFPVTVGEWRQCSAAKACSYEPDGAENLPVHDVSWADAQQYVTWLAKTTQQDYRLPTEAEWEYAARAGSTTKYWWGSQPVQEMANCKGCGRGYDPQEPAKVGSYPANAFGLHDMGGGVAQFVADCWFKDYQSAPRDGSARNLPNCREHVVRGGSWKHDLSYAGVTNRGKYDTGVRYIAHGVRVARSAKRGG